MMTAEQLKASILQMAMQGKLVEQKKEDSGEKYFDRIALETKNAIVLKEIGKPRKISSDIVESLEFDVPETWKKGNLQDICSLSDGVKVVGVCLPNLDAKYLRGKSDPVYKNSGKLIRQGERAILVDGENSGEVFIIPEDGLMGSTFKKLFINPIMEARFVLYVLEYYRPYFRNNKKGSAIPHLDKDLFASAPIGIPPIEEQKRIVAKIEELMPFVEQYAKTSTRLNALNASFPDQMKKSILQQAVMGKLVPQDPSDEPASVLLKKIAEEKQKLIKEGKIKKEQALDPISEDEIPFDIPENWKWARLGSLITVRGGKRLPAGKQLVTEKTDHIYIRVTDMKNETVDMSDLHYLTDDIYEGIKSYIIKKEDIFIVIVGSTIGKAGIIPDELDGMNLTENAARLTPYYVDKEFLLKMITSDFMQSQFIDKTHQVGQPKLALFRLKDSLIPVPPLNEQKRIVQKLKELSPQIDVLRTETK